MVVATAVWGVAPAMADIYDDYRRTGTINPCNYTPQQLRQGLQNLPPDVRQYAPGLADQLSAGREGCGGARGGAGGSQNLTQVPSGVATGGGGAGGAGGAAAGQAIPRPPSPTPLERFRLAASGTVPPVGVRPGGPDVPGWLVLLGLLTLAAGALVAAVRLAGWRPERLERSLAAASAEAGGHVADALGGLRDRVRPGR